MTNHGTFSPLYLKLEGQNGEWFKLELHEARKRPTARRIHAKIDEKVACLGPIWELSWNSSPRTEKVAHGCRPLSVVKNPIA